MALENKHKRLSEQVLEEVKRLIVTGTFAPNTQLSEVELAKRLGVSRTPVREALIRLAEDGLINIFPQIGSFVAPISFEAVEQAQFIREHLECALIAELAKSIDGKVMKQFRANIKKQASAARRKDWEAFGKLDEDFHSAIATVSGHPAVWRVIQQSKTQLDRVRYAGDRNLDHVELLVSQHTAIMDAIDKGDVAEARDLMRDHLREVFATIRELSIENQAQAPNQQKTIQLIDPSSGSDSKSRRNDANAKYGYVEAFGS